VTNIDPTLGRNIGPISCVTWGVTSNSWHEVRKKSSIVNMVIQITM